MTTIIELMDSFEVFVISPSNKEYFKTFCQFNGKN